MQKHIYQIVQQITDYQIFQQQIKIVREGLRKRDTNQFYTGSLFLKGYV